MTLQECYTALGGNYNDVIQRFRSEKLVIKFIFKFLDDPSYALLCKSMQENNDAEAFRAAHTMKGICQNLAFTRLYKSSYDMVEALRNGKTSQADMIFVQFQQDYKCCFDAIVKFKQEIGGEMYV